MINPINRNAVIITPKQSFFDMLERISGEKVGEAPSLLDYDESTVYLLEESEMDKFDLKEEMEFCFKKIFFEEVKGWFVDDDKWPKDVTWEEFTSYFNISYQSVVNDTIDEEIEHE